MTDETPEAESSTATSRPVRVPNVSAGAISGLGHEVIGAAAQEVYDAETGYDPDADDVDTDAEFDIENQAHVEALVGLVPEDRQLAVRQALTGEVIDGVVVTELDESRDGGGVVTTEPGVVYDGGGPVEGTQAGADPDSPLTGDGDPTNGALPTGDEPRPAPVLPDDLPDTVDARVAWAHEVEGIEQYDRAVLLLSLEAERDQQRSTLVDPLQTVVAAHQ